MRPVRKVTGSVVVLLVALTFWLFLRSGGSKELRYQGQPIGYWFAQLPVTVVSSRTVARIDSGTILGQVYGSTNVTSGSFAAFDRFGTNAVPFLLEKLQGSDSVIEQKATWIVWRYTSKPLPVRNAIAERGQSVTALIHLKELSTNAVQALDRLSTNAEPDVARAAKYILNTRRGAPYIPE